MILPTLKQILIYEFLYNLAILFASVDWFVVRSSPIATLGSWDCRWNALRVCVWGGGFLSDPNPYLRQFRKTPNGYVIKCDQELNTAPPVYQFWAQNRSATGGTICIEIKLYLIDDHFAK